ncbi:hypothetical protein FAGKG844_210066 [Frankia sp. AgKG'84/4]
MTAAVRASNGLEGAMLGTIGNGGGVARATTGTGMDTATRYRSADNGGRGDAAKNTTLPTHTNNRLPEDTEDPSIVR